MRWKAVGSSPLAIIALCLGTAGLWTCAYDSTVGQADEQQAAAREASPSTGSETGTSKDAERASEAESAKSTAKERGLRLRHPPQDDVLGLPIAIEDADGTSMDALHEALERASEGEGQARLLFYGASHVASEMFTGPVRERLQTRYGDAGHGFILPVHPWRSYRHRAIGIDSNLRAWDTLRIRANDGEDEYDYYGLAGVAVETDRGGAWGEVRTAEHGEIGRRASVFDLYYLKQPGGGDFDVYIDGARKARIDTGAAETEAGYQTFRVADGAHSLKIRTRGNGKVRIFGVAVERERPGVIVDTLGINGARARYHLLWDDELYREHLRRRDPDLVTLAYGTNESGDDRPIEDYEADVRKVVERVRETVPDASCLLIGPSDRPVEVEDGSEEGDGAAYRDRPRTAEVNRVQREVALDNGCGYFDLVAFQGGPLSMVDWAAHDPPYGAPDHIHYTFRGYARLGEELLGAMLEGFEPPPGVDEPADGPAVAARGATDG
ncbi:MAG: GDSL-type esterase/lipase family protein [Polyangiales bacterium]